MCVYCLDVCVLWDFSGGFLWLDFFRGDFIRFPLVREGGCCVVLCGSVYIVYCIVWMCVYCVAVSVVCG